MKYESILSLVVVAWLAASLGLQAAAPTAQDASLRHLFATALDARDFEYQKVREEILVHKGAASFLAKQAKSTNLMVRVIGRAMLSWRNNSATSRALIERLAATVRSKQGSHIGESAILDDLMRNAALRGLRLREDACLEIFLEGMEDQDQRYRKASYLLLRDISGQDFGHDPKRYRIWLEFFGVCPLKIWKAGDGSRVSAIGSRVNSGVVIIVILRKIFQITVIDGIRQSASPIVLRQSSRLQSVDSRISSSVSKYLFMRKRIWCSCDERESDFLVFSSSRAMRS